MKSGQESAGFTARPGTVTSCVTFGKLHHLLWIFVFSSINEAEQTRRSVEPLQGEPSMSFLFADSRLSMEEHC